MVAFLTQDRTRQFSERTSNAENDERRGGERQREKGKKREREGEGDPLQCV